MKLPAVAIATAFAGGILLSRSGSLPFLLETRSMVALCFAFLFFVLSYSLLLALRGRLWTAAMLSLMGWIGLGTMAMRIADRPLPEEHILTRLSARQIELKTPLRWHGTLRDEPARLPWGYGMDLELAGVDTAGGRVPLVGGMRLSFTPRGEDAALPEVHAGDTVTVLTQARLPQVFRDDGAFDRRAYLAQQNIQLVATLRASSLLERVSSPAPTTATRLARLRAKLRERLDGMYPDAPKTAGVLRAMLLGDRSFVDRAESVDFQKTGVFHVLVVAGLHVGALAFFVYWTGRRLRLRRVLVTLLVMATLIAYIAVVEQRAPVLRAGLMAGIVVLGSLFYRRLEILNSAGLAALVLLIMKPAALFDTSFQFSFLAIACIAGIALPWMERNLQPYLPALSTWRDVTRDGAYSAAQVQFRLDLRDWVKWVTRSLGRSVPCVAAENPHPDNPRVRHPGEPGERWKWMEEVLPAGLRLGLRGAELVGISVVLQLGMMPMMARDFHRVTLNGPAANLIAVPLTGVIVPLGFLALVGAMTWPAIGRVLGGRWAGWWRRRAMRLDGLPGWSMGVTGYRGHPDG